MPIPPPDPETAAGLREVVQLRQGVTLAATDSTATLLVQLRGERFAGLSPGLQAVIERLRKEPASEAELTELVGRHDGEAGVLGLHGLLARLRRGGWLETTLELERVEGARPLLSILPHAPHPLVGREDAGAAEQVVLSRFTVLRRDDDRLVAESPRAKATLTFHDPAVAELVCGLVRPQRPGALPGTGAMPAAAASRVLRTLLGYGFAVAAGDAEETELRLRQWSTHEAWFHSRVRMGRHDLPYGGTYWAKELVPPLPGRHEPASASASASGSGSGSGSGGGSSGRRLALARPDLERLRVAEPTLTEVLEERRSIREHDDRHPITLAQLGEFLFRSARVISVRPGEAQELTRRPYPSGGSVYELELYPVVANVAGLAAGMYRYDPYDHALEALPATEHAVRRLLMVGRRIGVMEATPQVLIVVAARFGRFMWKYQTMAYATILKHVGVVYMTMYCVATAMGLAPCGLGGGDAEDFAAATGLDFFAESSVGEFLLGSRVPPERSREVPKYGIPA
ncbi:MAG TPA: SagB family peptide dehydrogenase [Actinomycetota bacterium]